MGALDLKKIYESEQSDFYKKHWGKLPSSFSEVPLLHADDLARTPLYERLYKDEQGLVKYVSRNDQGFLIRRSLSDITNDDLHLPKNSIPLVLFADPNEGVEYSLFCYEQGTVPYIGDLSNLPVSLFCAMQFKTDTLICDMNSLTEILSKDEMPTTIKNIRIIDQSFTDIVLLKKIRSGYDVELFLSLPVAGSIGSVAVKEDGRLSITPQSGVMLECQDKKLIVTKTALAMPLVRYTTPIHCIEEDGEFYSS